MSVINDLVTDQRVDKMCRTLIRMGFDVLLVGRRKKDSLSIQVRAYQTHRFHLLFERGPLFYAEYNLRLFFFLLGKKADVLVSNDLDTLIPNFLNHKLKRIPLVYDSHEYFTGVPELESRPVVRKTWILIEKAIFPHLQEIITVNHSISDLYFKDYGKQARIVRNVPELKPVPAPDRSLLGLPGDKSIIVMQGAGINIDRGAEEALFAMKYLDNAVLMIIGGGDVLPVLKKIAHENRLDAKVIFIPKQPFDKLLRYTVCADIGLTLDKDTNVNYRFSLPNKLFDYILAGVPVLASALPEVRNIIETYDIGVVSRSHDPEILASHMRMMLNDREKMAVWKENLIIAARELCWEKEEIVLHDIYAKYL